MPHLLRQLLAAGDDDLLVEALGLRLCLLGDGRRRRHQLRVHYLPRQRLRLQKPETRALVSQALVQSTRVCQSIAYSRNVHG